VCYPSIQPDIGHVTGVIEQDVYLSCPCTSGHIADAVGIDTHLSALRPSGNRNDADRRLPVLLRLQKLWGTAEAQAGRLLRVLLLRLRAMSTDTGRQCLLLAFAIEPIGLETSILHHVHSQAEAAAK
jgi:hypothetical protein